MNIYLATAAVLAFLVLDLCTRSLARGSSLVGCGRAVWFRQMAAACFRKGTSAYFGRPGMFSPFSVGALPPFCCGCHFLRPTQAQRFSLSRQLFSPCLPGRHWCCSAQERGIPDGSGFSPSPRLSGSVAPASRLKAADRQLRQAELQSCARAYIPYPARACRSVTQ